MKPMLRFGAFESNFPFTEILLVVLFVSYPPKPMLYMQT